MEDLSKALSGYEKGAFAGAVAQNRVAGGFNEDLYPLGMVE